MPHKLHQYRKLKRDATPPEETPLELLWTIDDVKGRLVEAAKTHQRTAGRVAPKGYGSTMPAYSYDWGDLLNQAEAESLYVGGNQIRIGASSEQMTRCDEAMLWPIRYLGQPKYAPIRLALMAFLGCRARRESYNNFIRRKRWARATAFRARDRALGIIAVGLIRDGVPLLKAAGEVDKD